MTSPKLLIFLALWLSVSSALNNNETKIPEDNYSDGSSSFCADCNICPTICQAHAPPPPPPPAQINCPPPPPPAGGQVVCCENSPPVPYFFNPGNNPNNNPNNNPGNNGNNPGNNPGNNGGNNPGNGGNNGNNGYNFSLEHKIEPSAATWLSAAFLVFISIMVQV